MYISAAIVSLITLTSAVLGFIVNLLIAKYFGANAVVDTYLYSLGMPLFLGGIITSAVSFQLVPRIIKLERNKLLQKKFIGSLFFLTILLALLFLLFGMIGAQMQIRALPNNSAILRNLISNKFLYLAWLTVSSQIIVGSISAALNGVRMHRLAAFLSIFQYIGIIIALSVKLNASYNIEHALVGMLLGALFSALVGAVALRNQYEYPSWSAVLWDEFRAIYTSAPMVIVAMSCFSSYVFIDSFWASRSAVGTLSVLGYAQRMLQAIANLAISGPSAILVPHFASLIASNEIYKFKKLLAEWLVLIISVGVVSICFLLAFAKPIISIMFERGSFGKVEVELVANTLMIMTPGAVGMIVSVISFRALYCMKNTANIAGWIGLLWSALYFTISSVTYNFGPAGISIGYSVSWIVVSIALVCVTLLRSNNLR